MGLTETAIGPAFGEFAELGELMLKARDAGLSEDEQFRFGELFDLGFRNTPFVNLFYIRPALDYLFLNSLREVSSPGYRRRLETRRLKDYGQERIVPEPLDPFG